MTIEKKEQGNTVELSIKGWLDTQNAQLLADELDALDEKTEALVFDLSELDYISSSGIRQLVSAYKKMGGALTVRNASAEIMSIVKMTGLDRKMKFE